MPKYNPNSRFSDCWASMGNITFYHRDGQCYFRKKAVCDYPGTSGQTIVADVHRRALAAWRTLDRETQLLWGEYAEDVPSSRPPFDKTSHITGHNLFVSAYHGFAQLGNEHIPVPMRRSPFPDITVEIVCASDDGTGDLDLNVSVMCGQVMEAGRYRLAMKLQLTLPASGCNPGLMRNVIALENCSGDDSMVSFHIPEYCDVWNVKSNECAIFYRYFLIDTKTGFRGNIQRGKGVYEILFDVK